MRTHILCFVLLCSTTLFILLLKLALAVKSSLRLAPSSRQHTHILCFFCFFSEHFLVFWPHKMLQICNYASQGDQLTRERHQWTEGMDVLVPNRGSRLRGPITPVSAPAHLHTLSSTLGGSVVSQTQVHTRASNLAAFSLAYIRPS